MSYNPLTWFLKKVVGNAEEEARLAVRLGEEVEMLGSAANSLDYFLCNVNDESVISWAEARALMDAAVEAINRRKQVIDALPLHIPVEEEEDEQESV